MKERWRIVCVEGEKWRWYVEGDMEEKVEGCGGKNFRFWYQTIQQIDYFYYEGVEVG